MIKEISDLFDHLRIASAGSRERGFQSLLTDLLRDAHPASREELCCMAAVGPLRDAVVDHRLERLQERNRVARIRRDFAKTAAAAGVTYRSAGPGAHQQGVAVAVCADLLKVERVARCLALFPEPALAAAEENDAPECERGD